jgi:hypothetical protein
MGVAGTVQTGDATAYLVAEPLVEVVKTRGYSICTRRGALGSGGRIDQLATLSLGIRRLRLRSSCCLGAQPRSCKGRGLADWHETIAPLQEKGKRMLARHLLARAAAGVCGR